jgi:hypothetical protein
LVWRIEGNRTGNLLLIIVNGFNDLLTMISDFRLLRPGCAIVSPTIRPVWGRLGASRPAGLFPDYFLAAGGKLRIAAFAVTSRLPSEPKAHAEICLWEQYLPLFRRSTGKVRSLWW